MNPDLMAVTPVSTPDEQGDEAEKQWIIDQFYGGISDAEKQIVRTAYLLEKQYQFFFAQNGNILEYSSWFQINRSAVRDSPTSGANQITALPKWIVSGDPYTDKVYIYCADGKMFSRDASGNYLYLFTAANSRGNGVDMAGGYLYYTTNNTLGIYGPITGVATNNDSYVIGLNNTSASGLAPVSATFNNVNVGHGNYLGVFDILTSNWTNNYLTADTRTYIRSFSNVNQMLAVGQSDVGSLNANLGYVSVWDGQSTNFNTFSMTDGPVDALLNWKNNLLTFIGSANMLYQGMAPITANQRFPKLTQSDRTVILPGAVTEYMGQAMFGIYSTTSSIFQNGVYHWGNRNDQYPAAMNFDYTISTGNTTNVAIGALYGTSTCLFIGWADNNLGTYGVDIVQNTNPFYSSAFLEGVIMDDLRPVDTKNLLTIKCSHLPLNTGESIQLAFKINRGGYILSTVNSTAGSTYTKLNVPPNYSGFTEAQCKVIIGSPGTTTPTVTTLGAAYMPLLTQSQY